MPKASVGGVDATLSPDSSHADPHPESILKAPPSVPEPVSVQGKSGLLIIFSVIFLITAVVFCGMGLKEAYAYEYDDKIVRGDAYNFIILAARGTGLICVGIVSALIGVALAIFDLAYRPR